MISTKRRDDLSQQQRGQLPAVVVMYQRKMGFESTLMGWRFKPTETKPTQLEIYPENDIGATNMKF